ncbi:MAG: hypothetical protein KBD19_00085 [Candidatus Moranbacteria bacterium]|nr:hypothetical protein [Candidatus Moranbacteria bacterium]
MSPDHSSTIATVVAMFQAIQSSALFTALVWFLGLYTLVLFADIIMLLILRDIPSDLKKTLYGAKRPIVSQSRFQKRWSGIEARLLTENPSQYKAAVLEADALAEEMLAGIGVGGSNMGERLAAVREGQIVRLGELREGHMMRNRIIQDPAFALSREEADTTLEKYRKFFDELELF